MPFSPFDDRPFRGMTKVATTYGVLLVGNLAAWGWAWIAFADRPALLGIALFAYVFGLRHAFDADHIAAIDNVVRKLMQQGTACRRFLLLAWPLHHGRACLRSDRRNDNRSAGPPRCLA